MMSGSLQDAAICEALSSHPDVASVLLIPHATEEGLEEAVFHVTLRKTAWQIDPVLAGTFTRTWQQVYERNYARSSPDPEFDIGCWKSSYTGDIIPAWEMAAWTRETVERISRFRPRRILEIGCGSGLLLYRIAPNCESYVGLDYAKTVVDRLRANIALRGADLAHVEVYERDADAINEFSGRRFDMVIINSVIMYFPSESYLDAVLAQAARLLEPGGHIFVGDVRDRRLLELYYVGVERARAEPDMPCKTLLARAAARADQENQLLLTPQYFLSLERRVHAFSGVCLELKAAAISNEITKYRFDAVLQVGEANDRNASLARVDGSTKNIDDVVDLLRKTAILPIVVCDIENARLASEFALLSAMRAAGSNALREVPEQPCSNCIDPARLLAEAAKLGLAAQVRPARSGSADRFDAAFWNGSAAEPRALWSFPESVTDRVVDFTQTGLAPSIRRRMEYRLRQSLRKHLHERLGDLAANVKIELMGPPPASD